MSAERTEHSAVRLPFDLTLKDVAEMNESDELGRRFELSPEGVLSVMPPPTVEHQIITSQLIVWFAAHGWPPEHVLPAVGSGSSVPSTITSSRWRVTLPNAP